MPPLLIISPMFPPMEGGLPHHTDRLAAILSPHYDVTLLTSSGVETDRPFQVRAELPRWSDPRRLAAAIQAAAPTGPLLWQYVPHMYGRGGVNLGLRQVWRRLRSEGRRQVFIAHEIRAPLSPWPHRLAYALAHRWMWRGVRADADAIGISTAGWLERAGTVGGRRDRFFLAPSPANLPVAPIEPGHATRWRARHDLASAGAVLGFFGSPGAGKQFDWVLGSWRTARRQNPATALVVIGGRPEVPLGPDEAPWFRPLGYLDIRDASEALQALDVLGLPFIDGVSERRSSFMAGLSHGLPIVTVAGEATGAELRAADGFEATPPDPSEYAEAVAALIANPARREQLGRRARECYATRYDWPCLAATLRARIDGTPRAPGRDPG